MSSQMKIGASKKIIEETKRLYGQILAKPLDEKQLSRPSFKFIQDLVKSLMIETKLLRDVFNANHFNNATDKQLDKKAKIEFIQKIIDFAANNRQAVASCLAAKVVAGLEPNKTNELLQSLARIAQQKLGQTHDERRPRTFTRQTSGGGGGGSPLTSNQRKSISQQVDNNYNNKSSAEQQRKLSQKELAIKQQAADQAVQQSGASIAPVQVEQISSNQANDNQGNKRKPSSGNILIASQSSFTQSKQLSPLNLTSQQTNIVQPNVTSESDIVRGTQHVRGNLRSLRETFATICKVEDALKASLVHATRIRNNTITSA